LVVDTPNLPTTNHTHLTTIQNLYDVLTTLFSKVKAKTSIKILSFKRPSDTDLDGYYDYAVNYFQLLAKAAPELDAFFKAANGATVVAANRNDSGGSILFRPVGQIMFAHIAEALVNKMDLPTAIKLMGKLPRELKKAPYRDLLWNRSSKTLNLKNQVLVRRVLLYMLGHAAVGDTAAKLRTQIGRVTEQPASGVTLPTKVV
jgi:DNA sulfur modification protein DndB